MSPILGQDAATLAALAHIDRPYDIQLLVVPTESLAPDNYLAAEKLAPVVSLFTVADMDEGLNVCRAVARNRRGRPHGAYSYTQR